MNTPTITMPTRVARDQLRAYRKQLHRRADTEYQAVAQGLEELAKGTPLLNLADCFKDVPVDAKYRPRLAIARADQRRVWFKRTSSVLGQFRTKDRDFGRPGVGRTHTLEIPAAPVGGEWWRSEYGGTALVPMIPASVRETVGRFNAANHFLLWEVEEWTDSPPRDPYLLRHCGGSLYAILAEWDLTELERAVMAGRPRD